MVSPAIIVCFVLSALLFGAYVQTRVKTRNQESGLPLWVNVSGVSAIVLTAAGVLLGRTLIAGIGIAWFCLGCLLGLLMTPRGTVRAEDVLVIVTTFGLLCYMAYRGFWYAPLP